jgi:metal-responsive CopG/Arc/MetJ family transcriptional regulator
MRTLVDIGEADLKALDLMAKEADVSRASLIRAAIRNFIERRETSDDEAFGLWGDRKTDGLTYQERLRSEW